MTVIRRWRAAAIEWWKPAAIVVLLFGLAIGFRVFVQHEHDSGYDEGAATGAVWGQMYGMRFQQCMAESPKTPNPAPHCGDVAAAFAGRRP